MEAPALLDVHGVCRAFPRPGGGELTVLEDVDLTLKEGEIVGLLGSFARQTRLVLAIEDVDKADVGTLRLIEQLSFRAAEVPLTLVLTHRRGRSD